MQYSFDYADIRQKVLAFLDANDLRPHDESDIILDGELHRYRTHDDKRNNKSGAICIHTDGWPAGFVQDWRKGIKLTWKYDISGLDDEQQAYFNSEEFKKKSEEEHRKAEEARQKKHLERSAFARRLWESLKPAPENHPYLQRKQVNPYGLRFNPQWNDGQIDILKDCLAVPLRNIQGELMSLQWIPADPNAHKLFYQGAEMKGSFFSIALDTLNKDSKEVILLGEGYATMAKVYELTSLPCVAAMTCFRLKEIASILHEAFPLCKIIMMADNDWETEAKNKNNPGIREAKAVVERKLAVDVVAPEFSSKDEGMTDWDDYALKYGDKKTKTIIAEKILIASLPDNIKNMAKKHKLQMVNGQTLRDKHFDPIKWAVPGFLPSGLSILGGGPKIGKSMLALHISVGVAIGGCVLGKIDVEQGDVLYLALEDTERRLQDRIEGSNIVDADTDISRLTIACTVPRQHEGGIEFLEWWLREHPNARLVIIDTLQKFRKQLSGKGSVYAEDYDVVSELKALADKYDVAFLVLHHLKKMSAKEELTSDWINSFSGSIGLSGSADALFILKRERSSSSGRLYRTGRDVEEKEFWLKLDGFGWYLEAEAEDFALPTWKKQIVDYLKEHESVTPSELSEAASISIEAAQKNLQRLYKEGLISRVGYGKYSLA